MELEGPVHRMGGCRARREGRARRRRPPGGCCVDAGLRPDVVHTSVLTRAISTANVALEAAGLSWLPVRRSWRLNERHYGALQGKDKAQTREEFGDEQFMTWRRSYDVPPPPLADDDPLSQAGDPRYALLPPELMPRTECLSDVVARMLPVLVRRDRARPRGGPDGAGGGARQLAARAGQAPGRDQRRGDRRAQHPDRHPAAATSSTTAFAPTVPGGRYLDPEAAKAAAEAVKNQGR